MIKKRIDGQSVSVIPEESDDLLILRRIIRPGDRIAGSTTRVIKREREYSRPDRGERVRIRVALDVGDASLDSVLDRLRIRGTVTESDNESVPHGSHHSMLVQAGDAITITKKEWSGVERGLLGSGGQGQGFILVAIDTADCGIARLRGTHLEKIPDIRSGAGGKRYKTSFRIEGFFEEAAGAVRATLRAGDSVIIFGPGETRKRLANYLGARAGGTEIRTVEGIDSAGEDGIYTFTKSEAMRGIMAGSKLAEVCGIIDRVMEMANKKSTKFSMGYEETRKANDLGAVESLVFSDRIIQDAGEQEVIDLLNNAEGRGVRSFGVDSTTDVGLRVDGLGGMVSILRFPVGG